MKSVKITLESGERLKKLVEYYLDGKLIDFEVVEGMMREVDEKIAKFFYPE